MAQFHSQAGEEHTHIQSGIRGIFSQIFHVGGHTHPAAGDARATTEEGMRTIWIALGVLGITSLLQIGVFALSGSTALLADTLHNIGDTLNSVPLLVAFTLARWAATRRFTYGFGRAEDLAGVLIVLSIVISAVVILHESIQRLLNPVPMQNIPLVALAAVIGFAGNEIVARIQIRVGRRIGSDAMIADGLHARIDSLTSLAVLVAVAGTLIGLPILDPIIGLLISIIIFFVAYDAARRVWFRLMDAVDTSLVAQIEHYTSETAGVTAVHGLRARWVGHQLFAELKVVTDEQMSLAESHQLSQNIRQALVKAIPNLGEVVVEVLPAYAVTDQNDSLQMDMSAILPPRYMLNTPSAAPMGAAALKLDADGKAAWGEIWTDFCDLALAGGPSHRGTLLEPVNPEVVRANLPDYEKVIAEMERGIHMVTGLETTQSSALGWVGMRCTSEKMALWLVRAIIVENVSVRREATDLYFPASPEYRLDKEIKNVITVIAKTTHYWQEHMAANLLTSAN